MKKPRILMIGCGGTIGMTPGKDGALRPAQSVEEIVQHVPGIVDHAEIELLQLLNKDSTNIGSEDWTTIAKAISEEVCQKGFQGIIITHGTDSMAYTASALSFAFGRNLTVPIALTGAQLPVSGFLTDAIFNLKAVALTMVQAIERDIAEVMVVFNDLVLRGNRTIKTSEAHFRAFDSPAYPPLARISASGIEFSTFVFKRRSDQLAMRPNFHPNVVTIELTPGASPEALISMARSRRCQGVLLKSLGAGNVPDSWLPALSEVIGKYRVPVLASTQFVGGRTHIAAYEPGRKAMEIGVIPTMDMTTPAAAVKLMWLLANGHSTVDDIRFGIAQGIAGEID